ncbi:MAG TPA: YbaN family protein, partial [Modicisalibacter sp.]|nr:YbaN family protein [Modicisalibacter sp.]
WLASRGSPRFALWIRRHPRFGPPILAWEGERAIPRHAKWLAVVMLALPAIVIAFTVDSLWLCGSLIAGLVLLALWIATRPEPFQPLAERSVTPSATEPPTAERLSTPSLSTQRLSTQRLGR